MNATARVFGMSHTTYTDPSGYDSATISTALDQLRLAQVVAKDKTLADLMATHSYWLPIAGEVTNTNTQGLRSTPVRWWSASPVVRRWAGPH